LINLNRHSKNSKSIFAAILAIALITSTFAATAIAFTPGQSYASPNYADYIVTEGVAANDYYDSRQYSYVVNQWALQSGLLLDGDSAPIEYVPLTPANIWFTAKKSIRVGMTEFGEFATPDKAGIAYGKNDAEWEITESWASDFIDSKYWIQGWTFSMTYMRQGEERSIHSWAIYSDLAKNEEGRKVRGWFGDYCDYQVSSALPTEGYVIPSGVEVLYDSARLLVARTSTTVVDGYFDEEVAMVTFTLVFNKDTKYAIVYKDLKILLDSKILDSITDLAFSERYEIDLARGLNPSNTAYIHYYNNFSESAYDHPLVGINEFDVVQAFNPGRDYIFFAGYWPACTEYTVYNPLVPRTNIVASGCNFDSMRILNDGEYGPEPQHFDGETNFGATADMPVEPSTPWVIAQWRYNRSEYPQLFNFLAKADIYREIRFVEVFGMTDYNTYGEPENTVGDWSALDEQADGENFVDVEVQYLLNKVFNPEDLTTIGNVDSKPFLWTGLGQSSATTDSAGGVMLTDLQSAHTPLSLFDRHDELFPWTFDNAFEMRGTIPYGLDEFGGNYGETFNNLAKTTGSDDTSFYRTGLKGFAFSVYDGSPSSMSPQPIAGGYSNEGTPAYKSPAYWYPAKDPLTERWTAAWVESPYVLTENNGILSIGGVKANGLTRYFNDMNFAITREGTDAAAYVYLYNSIGVTGEAPTSNPTIGTFDYFPISTWNHSSTFDYREGYAVISLARDLNGTRGLSVYGWDGRDTYWAAAWASQYLDAAYNDWVPAGATAIILRIDYSSELREPTVFTVAKVLGTITEFGSNQFWDVYVNPITGFDASANEWDVEDFTLPTLSAVDEHSLVPCEYKVWWFAKLPTISVAHVDFDP